VNDLNITVGSVGDILYFDPAASGNLTDIQPLTGILPVYIKISPSVALLKSSAGASGSSGTSGSTSLRTRR
jgi:hypothetical protein